MKDQYAFIHDAVLEWLICGDTKIPAGEMKRAMERLLQKEIHTGENGYDTQFKVPLLHVPTHINNHTKWTDRRTDRQKITKLLQ